MINKIPKKYLNKEFKNILKIHESKIEKVDKSSLKNIKELNLNDVLKIDLLNNNNIYFNEESFIIFSNNKVILKVDFINELNVFGNYDIFLREISWFLDMLIKYNNSIDKFKYLESIDDEEINYLISVSSYFNNLYNNIYKISKENSIKTYNKLIEESMDKENIKKVYKNR